MGWKKIAEPAVRFKDTILGDRGTIGGNAGMYTRHAYVVDADYARRQWVLWFEDIGEVRLPWLDADPWAFDPWCHEGHLKLFFKQYQSPDLGNHRRLGVYDTGYAYIP